MSEEESETANEKGGSELRHFRYLQNLRRHHKHCEDRYEKMLLNTTQKEKSDEPIIPELKRTESVILDRNSSEWDKCEKKATKHKKKSNKQLQDDDHVPDKMEIHREKISCSQPRPQKSCTSETKGSTDTRERERSCRSRATTSTSLDEDSQTSTFQEPSSRPRTSSDLSFPEDSEMSHSEESKGPKGRKQVQKRPWTTKEIEAVEKTLFDFIQTGKVPGKAQCTHCIESSAQDLEGRTWQGGRCYGGRCKTRDGQCRTLWGYNSADRFCYEKLNSEGTEQGNCGPDATGHGWTPCNKPDVLCGLLLCTNMTLRPSFGELRGKVTSLTIYHQSRYLDCRGGHAVLDDGLDLGYVEDGTPCGPNMMCLERRCLPVTTFNLSTCPGSSPSRICSSHGTCNNEVKCICDPDYTGTDCSVFDPTPIPTPPEGAAAHKGPSGTNIIIGSVAGAILVVAIILGGTGWGFKNIRRGRSGG